MTVKIGSIIENKDGLFVITQIIDGVVSDTERLEDYVIKNSLVKEGKHWITIK